MWDAVIERQAYMRAVIETLQQRRLLLLQENSSLVDAAETTTSSSSSCSSSAMLDSPFSSPSVDPLPDGSTAVYVAAESGKSSEVLILAQLGADVHSANVNGWTPVIIAACNDQSKIIEILGEYGADMNAVDKNKDSAITIAAFNGCINALHTLVEYGADVDQSDGNGVTPMVTAFMAGKKEATVKLMQLGADPSQFVAEKLRTAPEHPACMVYHDVFCQGVHESAPCGLIRIPDSEKNALFKLAKLMSSCCGGNAYYSSNNDYFLYTDMASQTIFEADVAKLFLETVSEERVQVMSSIPYPIRRKVCALAYRILCSSLILDGDRIVLSAKVRRYKDILCLLLDKEMLKDTLALRSTCKSNNENRRFPVSIAGDYHELETNLVESFVAFESSRFVDTSEINAAIRLLSSQ